MLNIELTNDEIEILNRIIAVPLSAFGRDDLLEKTGLELEEIKSIKQKIQSAIDAGSYTLSMGSQEYSKLKNIFRVACEIVDPHEVHALTAYSWDDVMGL